MRVFIYARVSKDEASSDGQLQNPENQILPLKTYCQSMGWQIIEEFVDYASGGISNRPEFQRMLGRVRQRHCDLVFVWALDRFSREGMKNTLAYINTLKSYKTGLKSYQESWLDTSQEGVGELLIAIFSWVAQQERKRISERTKAGLELRRKAGIKLGRPRKIETNPKTKTA